MRPVQPLAHENPYPHRPELQHPDHPLGLCRHALCLAQARLGNDEGRDLDPSDGFTFRDQLAVEEGKDRDILDTVERLQTLDVDLEDAVHPGAQPDLTLDRAVDDDAGAGDHLRQASSGLILMNIARLHAHDVELIDASARHYRPVLALEDPALEQQDPMVVVGHKQRLGQHRALDPLRAQACAP